MTFYKVTAVPIDEGSMAQRTEFKKIVIVSDGTTLWLYYPSTHPGQVIRSTIDANATGAGMVDLQVDKLSPFPVD